MIQFIVKIKDFILKSPDVWCPLLLLINGLINIIAVFKNKLYLNEVYENLHQAVQVYHITSVVLFFWIGTMYIFGFFQLPKIKNHE